jgi:hypothetical protein
VLALDAEIRRAIWLPRAYAELDSGDAATQPVLGLKERRLTSKDQNCEREGQRNQKRRAKRDDCSRAADAAGRRRSKVCLGFELTSGWQLNEPPSAEQASHWRAGLRTFTRSQVNAVLRW